MTILSDTAGQRHPALAPALAALGAASLFSVNDMAIKALSGGYALQEIVLFRSVTATIVILALTFALGGGIAALRVTRPGLQVLRGLAVVLSNLAFFTALASLPLAEAVAIFFVAPLVITLLSVILLKERVTALGWAGVGLGLIGVLIIVRPGTEAFQPAAVLPLMAAATYAALQILTRHVGRADSVAASALAVQAAFVVTCAGAGLWFGDGHLAGTGGAMFELIFRAWVWPTLPDLGILALTGLASGLGGWLISLAYQRGPAGMVATFEYVSLPLALFWGLAVFAEWPDGLALAGIALIAVAGLVTIRGTAR